jgi:hypothetical protein
MTVHSTSLGHGASLAVGLHTLYTVPTGKRSLAKWLSLYNHGSATNRVVVEVNLAGTDVVIADPILAAAGAAGDYLELALWIVLNAADSFKVSSQSAAIDATLNGAVFTLP